MQTAVEGLWIQCQIQRHLIVRIGVRHYDAEVVVGIELGGHHLLELLVHLGNVVGGSGLCMRVASVGRCPVVGVSGMRGAGRGVEIIHLVEIRAHVVHCAFQRLVGEHACVVVAGEGERAREQLDHLRGVQMKVFAAGDVGDAAQRGGRDVRARIAGHGIHVHLHLHDRVFEEVQALVVAVGAVVEELGGDFERACQIVHSVEPMVARHRVAHHAAHPLQCLRINAEGGHIAKRHLDAVTRALRTRHNGGERVEIPLHRQRHHRLRFVRGRHRRAQTLGVVVTRLLAD